MKKKYKKIYILLISIILLASILLYKIEKSPKYDVDIYEQVYKEYEQISKISTTLNTPVEKITIDTEFTTAILDIPKINISYPILKTCTEDNLKIAPTKLVGPVLPNSIGNFVIVAHNRYTDEFFSNLHKLEKNDLVYITNLSGQKTTYTVLDKYEIKEDDFSCLNQDTNGEIELTLMTCIKYKKDKRLIVKCIAM